MKSRAYWNGWVEPSSALTFKRGLLYIYKHEFYARTHLKLRDSGNPPLEKWKKRSRRKYWDFKPHLHRQVFLDKEKSKAHQNLLVLIAWDRFSANKFTWWQGNFVVICYQIKSTNHQKNPFNRTIKLAEKLTVGSCHLDSRWILQ